MVANVRGSRWRLATRYGGYDCRSVATRRSSCQTTWRRCRLAGRIWGAQTMKKSFDLIPLNQIVPNPWRDLKLNPLDDEHVADLRDAMGDFEFQGALTGRRRSDGKIEIAYGHARLAAARKAKNI